MQHRRAWRLLHDVLHDVWFNGGMPRGFRVRCDLGHGDHVREDLQGLGRLSVRSGLQRRQRQQHQGVQAEAMT